MKHSEIIVGIGGTAAVAKRFGLGQSAVSNWSNRGIPWRYRPLVAQMAEQVNFDLPEDFLISEKVV